MNTSSDSAGIDEARNTLTTKPPISPEVNPGAISQLDTSGCMDQGIDVAVNLNGGTLPKVFQDRHAEARTNVHGESSSCV
jgi:hypothetical protein